MDSLLDTLRELRNEKLEHCLHAVMLAGTDSLHRVLDEHNVG